MGRATNDKEEQLTYIKRRTKLLAEVVEHFDIDQVDSADLANVLSMLEALSIKVSRFKKDWDK